MIGLGFTLLAIIGTFRATRRSLGHGLGMMMLFGYFYGILRARHPDGISHFIFDGAVAGLYLAILTGRKRKKTKVGSDGQMLRLWVRALMVWPLCTLVLAPFFDSQHFFIQMVGLRTAILLLPLILLGAQMTEEEVDTLGTWVLWLNAVAFFFALLELQFGVEAFFPENPITALIYMSNDVGEERALRIPAIFNTAHAYGGTMVVSIPLLVRRWQRLPAKKSRMLTGAVFLASLMGIFICAARSPVVHLVASLGLLLLVTRPSVKLLSGVAVMVVGVGFIVLQNPRFQRFLTLDDTKYVTYRVGISVNASLMDVITNFPMGNGLGSAMGTSIPFFLMDLAKPQHGMENEFARIAMEQGIVGLMLWLFFVFWLFTRLPPQRRGAPVLALRLCWAMVVVLWGTAFIGTGVLSSVPGTGFLLLWMGMIIGARRPVPVARPVTTKAKEHGLPSRVGVREGGEPGSSGRELGREVDGGAVAVGNR